MIVLTDSDVKKAVRRLQTIIQTGELAEYAEILGLQFCGLSDLGLADDATDYQVWTTCQRESAVLITGNRTEKDGPDSLEQIIKNYSIPDSLPIITIPDKDRVTRDNRYANACARSLIEWLDRIEKGELRGTGRLWLRSE